MWPGMQVLVLGSGRTQRPVCIEAGGLEDRVEPRASATKSFTPSTGPIELWVCNKHLLCELAILMY